MSQEEQLSWYYNISQKRLVERSERTHEAGIRATGLSGRICEFLLKEYLQNEISELRFDSGIIILKETDQPRPKELIRSSQIDIIVYEGQPRFRIANVCSVDITRVVACIEVKKWTSPTDITDPTKFNTQINKLKQQTESPIFFVSFRHYHQKLSRKELKRKCAADHAYVFSKENKRLLYPWEDSSNWLYPGELEGLVMKLKEFV